MKYLVDSANTKNIQMWCEAYPSIFEGATTNPGLLKQEGLSPRDAPQILPTISSIEGVKKIFFQVRSREEYIDIRRQIEDKYYLHAKNIEIVFKIPAIKENISFIYEPIHFNDNITHYSKCTTMVYNIAQAQLAFDAGIEYTIALVNKNPDDQFVERITKVRDNGGYSTKIIGASIHNKDEVFKCIENGFDYVTAKSSVFNEVFEFEELEVEWNKSYNE